MPPSEPASIQLHRGMPNCLTSGLVAWQARSSPRRRVHLWRTDLELVEIMSLADHIAGGRFSEVTFQRAHHEVVGVRAQGNIYAYPESRLGYWWSRKCYVRPARDWPNTVVGVPGVHNFVTPDEFLSFVEWYRAVRGFVNNPGTANVAYFTSWMVQGAPYFLPSQKGSVAQFCAKYVRRALTAALLAWTYGVRMERAAEIAVAHARHPVVRDKAIRCLRDFGGKPEASLADLVQLAGSFPVRAQDTLHLFERYAGEVQYSRPDPLGAIRAEVARCKAAGYVSLWEEAEWPTKPRLP